MTNFRKLLYQETSHWSGQIVYDCCSNSSGHTILTINSTLGKYCYLPFMQGVALKDLFLTQTLTGNSTLAQFFSPFFSQVNTMLPQTIKGSFEDLIDPLAHLCVVLKSDNDGCFRRVAKHFSASIRVDRYLWCGSHLWVWHTSSMK